MLPKRTFTVGSGTVLRMAVCSVGSEAGAEGLQRHGPEHPVDGDPGPLPLRALGVGNEPGGGGDQVRRVTVGPLDAPGEVLERYSRQHTVLLERGGRGRRSVRGCALAGSPVAEAEVLHKDRGDDGEGDGDEGKHETVVNGVREAHPGGVQDLLHELLPAGEGGSEAVPCIASLVADQRVRVLERIYQAPWGLRRGVVLPGVSVTRGDER